MTSVNPQHCLSVALKLVKEAGELVRDAIKKKKNVETKSSVVDLVTESDKAVEKLLITGLSGVFPDHKFIGEESVAAGEKCVLTDEPTWIIDPIDGTMNFVHSFPYTCISVALWVNKDAEVGIVYNPVLEQMFTAVKGQGAFLNDEKISASGQTDLGQALVFSEMGTSRDPEKVDTVLTNLTTLITKVHGIRAMGSCTLNMCHVALGGVDICFEFGIHAWDMAAGYLIIKEAGGVVIDTEGGPFDLMRRRVLCASTQELAEKIAKLLKQYQPERDGVSE
ncbi:inositol monophosphatase 1-like isoform X1 [Homarus americanus]|uniref:inositol monophosphatase 1-like isoform X1 n=1 Tax=Homarus americanus TaxID=6706 RepID=UPI001C48D586|nr:inositol monophosphatase 1-like isoform X1 [Homarus americanus]